MRLLLLVAAILHGSVAFAQSREVIDSTGRIVRIPDQPQRIVALHEPLIAVPLLELGLNVVGAYGRSDDGGSLMGVDFIDAVLGPAARDLRIPGIGAVGNIDLERLRALEPDLIVGTERHARYAEMMAPIAPLYLQNSSSGEARGFSAQEDLAELLNRQDVFAARKAAYLDRVKRIRAALPADPKGQDYLVLFIHDQINVAGEITGVIQAVEDLGYERLALEAEGERGVGQSSFLQPISPEVLGRLDPDLLVVMNGFVGSNRDEAAIRADLDRILPGWDRFLKPARDGRILYVDSAQVTTPSIASAEHTLDAFEAWSRARQQ